MKNKKGYVELIFLMLATLLIITITFCGYMIYVQITTYFIPLKQDLFYIVQNAYFSLNKDNLEYNEYLVDNNLLFNRIDTVLKSNYNNCSLYSIKYNNINNSIDLTISVNMEPVVLKTIIGKLKFKINDNIKLKTLEVIK